MAELFCKDCGSKLWIHQRRDGEIVRYKCSSCGSTFSASVVDEVYEDFVEGEGEVEYLERKVLDLQTQNRLLRRSDKSDYKYVNFSENYMKHMLEAFKDQPLVGYKKIKHVEENREVEGIIQLSDLHFGEYIDEEYNYFDFIVGSKRIRKLYEKSVKYFKSEGIKVVHVFCTGDFINSDRRLDEYTTNMASRANAHLMTIEILKGFFQDLSQDFILHVYCVVGNESRIDQEPSLSDWSLSNNYDLILFRALSMLLNSDQIIFHDNEKNYIQQHVKVLNSIISISHGEYVAGNDIEKTTTTAVGSVVLSTGLVPDYQLFGHRHSCRIAEFYARSSSLCGANRYSYEKLKLASRASQNIGIVTSKKEIEMKRVDLHNADDYTPYPFRELYNCYYGTSTVRKHLPMR